MDKWSSINLILINAYIFSGVYLRRKMGVFAMIDSARELLQACNSARQLGSDFPAIWQQILKQDSFVTGMPIQGMNSEGPTLEVPLLIGQRLIFGAKGISLDKCAEENGFTIR